MGRKTAPKPEFLSDKLTKVRLLLGFTQEQMYGALKESGANLHLGYISLFEAGQRVPSLLVLLAYSKVSGILMEAFVDDRCDLPEIYSKYSTDANN